MSDINWNELDLGVVSAFGVAKKNGWTGTEAEWEALQAAAPQKASDAEAYAAGTRSGEAVDSDDPAYQNNANYYAGQAAASAAEAAQYTSDAVATWLEENVDPETGYVLDRTLTQSDAATPADITGELKSAFDEYGYQNEVFDGVALSFYAPVGAINATVGSPIDLRTTGARAVINRITLTETCVLNTPTMTHKVIKVDSSDIVLDIEASWANTTTITAGSYYILLYSNVTDVRSFLKSMTLFPSTSTVNRKTIGGIADKANNAISKYADIYAPHSSVPSKTNDGDYWYCYKSIILQPGFTYTIKTKDLYTSSDKYIRFALLNIETLVVSGITSQNGNENDILTFTVSPQATSYLIFQRTCYESYNSSPTSSRLSQTSISNGDTVSFSSFSNNTIDFDITIKAIVTTEQIYNVVAGTDKPYVTVKSDGTGDYTNVISAVQSVPEGTVIYIYPGVYDGTIEAFEKRIILIGTDRNQCILRSTDGRYAYPAINGSCGYFENLTLISEYISGTSHEIDSETSGAYAFHCENEYGKGKTLEFHHCTLISDFCPALGAGLRKDFHLVLDDCILENRQILNRGVYTDVGSLGALYFHDSNGEQGNNHIMVKNCLLKSSLGKTMTPYQVDRETQNNHVYCTFIENVLYDAINKYSNNIWYRHDPFNPSTGIFSIDIGFGNSNANLNNNT